MSFAIPTLETDRLILRAPGFDDQAALAGFGARKRSEWVGGPWPAADAWGMLLRLSGHWHIRGYGLWLITLRGDDTAIGWTGGIYHADWPEPELGWSLFDDAHEGQGIAAEAALRARRALADDFGIRAPISPIAPANDRSAALALRLGAVKETQITLRGKPADIYRHPDVRGAA